MDLKQVSKVGRNVLPHEENKVDIVQLSALVRIADAAETTAQGMAYLLKERQQLERDISEYRRKMEMYKQWYHDQGERLAKSDRSNAALRGVITRLKREKREDTLRYLRLQANTSKPVIDNRDAQEFDL